MVIFSEKELTSDETLWVLYLSSQYCVHILYSCWTLKIYMHGQ